MLSDQQSHLNMSTTLAQAGNRIYTCFRGSNGVNRHMPPTASQLTDRTDQIVFITDIYSRIGTQLSSHVQLFISNIHSKHFCTDSLANHYRGQSHPATAMHNQPLSGFKPTLVKHSPEGRYKAATKVGCGYKIKTVRQAYQVLVGIVDGHQFSE